MKLDKSIMPESLSNYLTANTYDAGTLPTDISATRLKDSPRVNRLFKEHASKITIDYKMRGFAKLGEAWHDYMDRYAPDHWITERRFYANVNGRLISGAIDAIEPTKTGHNIWDYKLMTAYKAQTELKEFEQQLNIYAFLLRENGFTPEGLFISAIIRDWSDKKVSGNYPDTMFPVFKLKLWEPQVAEDYIKERLSLHFSEELPLCTDEERWMSAPKFAVVSKASGKTLRLYNDHSMALNHKTKTAVIIEKREAEPIRCQRFCEVAEFCDQYQSELFTKECLDGQ